MMCRLLLPPPRRRGGFHPSWENTAVKKGNGNTHAAAMIMANYNNKSRA